MNKRTPTISVFIVDSNVLMRRILASILQREEGVIISGSTGSGSVEEISRLVGTHHPDILFLAIDREDSMEMELFHHLRTTYPDLRTVLLTPLSKEGAAVALKGLRSGAIDYVTKPLKPNGLILAERHFHKRVIPSLIVVSQMNRRDRVEDLNKSGDSVLNRSLPDIGKMSPGRIELAVIGSCIGGVPSLFEIISKFPERLSVPVVVVHHMPKMYTNRLASELNRVSKLSVVEAENGSRLLPGTVYVAPGGFHTIIQTEGGRKRITLHKGPREHKCRPSIDVLLRSAVQAYGEKILGVFVSGGGSDGLLGALRVLESGGKLLVESADSALVPDLAQKVTYLNSNIKTIPAADLSLEIVKSLQPLETGRGYRSRKRIPSASDATTELSGSNSI